MNARVLVNAMKFGAHNPSQPHHRYWASTCATAALYALDGTLVADIYEDFEPGPVVIPGVPNVGGERPFAGDLAHTQLLSAKIPVVSLTDLESWLTDGAPDPVIHFDSDLWTIRQPLWRPSIIQALLA